jgi:tRNA(fMet)-specific endonuclease VapC
MNYLLDTNIILLSVRDEHFRLYIYQKYFQNSNLPIISVVSIGELRSLALRNGWGEQKWKKLAEILNTFLIADIHSEDVIQCYAEIDAFSQGKLPNQKAIFSAKNMGKNDLWIAATASVLSVTLLTTDNDFTHLEDHFIQIERINTHL